jgi:hypothetical protein
VTQGVVEFGDDSGHEEGVAIASVGL